MSIKTRTCINLKWFNGDTFFYVDFPNISDPFLVMASSKYVADDNQKWAKLIRVIFN